MWTGTGCNIPQCPGNFLNNGAVFKSCSGQGDCIQNAYTKLPQCSCFVDGESGGRLSDLDCGAPSIDQNATGLPRFSITSLNPNVGPTSGGTMLTLQGLGIDRVLSRFNFIGDSQISSAVSGQNSAFSCVMEFCADNTAFDDCQNLTATPITWETVVVVSYVAQAESELSLYVGDTITIFGCNPCSSMDSSGNFQPGRLVASVNGNGKIGYAPGDLHMYAGETRDRFFCSSSSAPSQGMARLFIVGQSSATTPGALLTGNFIMGNTQADYMFRYYSYEQLVRIDPDYAPLRYQGGTRGPSDIDKPVTVTITGISFIDSSYYSCMFYDESDLDDQCRSPATRVNEGTLTCIMPPMRRGKELKLRVSSNSQQFSPSFVTFRVYQVVSIDPVCSPWIGSATVTVFGDNLIRASPAPGEKAVCRFGRVSSTTGATSNAELTVWFAYHSIATPSVVSPGALECPAPPVYLELHDFAISLSSCECGSFSCPPCLFSWSPPTGGQNYYSGYWDSAQGPLQDMSGLPPVFFITIQAPTVLAISPSIGPLSGLTQVTVSGLNFSTGECPWGYNAFPSCSFGYVTTSAVSYVSPEVVICTSPASTDVLESKINVEIAVDGQSYTSNGVVFQYILPFATEYMQPSLGAISGGSTVKVMAPSNLNLFETSIAEFEKVGLGRDTAYLKLGLFKFTPTLACVFISEADLFMSVVTPAIFLSDKLLTCASPGMISEIQVGLFVSPNNQSDFSQLSFGNTSYAYYSDVSLDSLVDVHGPTDGGTLITVIGNHFQNSANFQCRFNTTSVIATFISPERALCTVPRSKYVGSVQVRISLNGLDFSKSFKSFYYYRSVSLIPSLGPAQGGNTITVGVDTGGMFPLSMVQCDLRLGGSAEIRGQIGGSGDALIFSKVPKSVALGKTNVYLSIQSSNSIQGAAISFLYEYYSLIVYGIEPLPITYSDGMNSFDVNILVYASSIYPVSCKFAKDIIVGSSLDTSDVVVNGKYDVSGSKISCSLPAVSSSLKPVFRGWNISLSMNMIDWTSAAYVKLFSKPTIQSVNPRISDRRGGAVLTITGENFISSEFISCRFMPYVNGQYVDQIWVRAVFDNSTQVRCFSPSSDSTSDKLLPYAVDVSLNDRDVGLQADGLDLGIRAIFSFYSYADPIISHVSNRTGNTLPLQILLYGVNLNFDDLPAPSYWVRISNPPFCDAGISPTCWKNIVFLNKSSVISNSKVSVPIITLPAGGSKVVLGLEYSLNGGRSVAQSPTSFTYYSLNPSCLSDLDGCGLGICGSSSDVCQCLSTGNQGLSYSFSTNPLTDILSAAPPYSGSPFSAGLTCDNGPQILMIGPNSGPVGGGTRLFLTSAYYTDPATCGIWCKISPYRPACMFNITYFNGVYNTALILSNISRRNSSGGWIPWGAASRTQMDDQYLGDSAECSLPSSDPYYKCLACKTPSLVPFLSQSVVNFSVSVHLTFVTDDFVDCPNGLGSCDSRGQIFKYLDNSAVPASPLIGGVSDTNTHHFMYYRSPIIANVTPLSCPVNKDINFTVTLQTSNNSLSNSVKQAIIEKLATCRLDKCVATGCMHPGASCACAQDQGLVLGSQFGILSLVSEQQLTCRISSSAVYSAGLYSLAITINGQDWFYGNYRNSILFFNSIVLLDHTIAEQRLSFGVAPAVGTHEPGDYPRIGPSTGGTSLVGYYQQTCNTSALGSDVNCAMLINSGCTSADNACQGRASAPTLRFVPGRCSGSMDCSCSDLGSRDTSVQYDGRAAGYYNRFTATTPPPLNSQAVSGIHHVCFSLDGNYFEPMILVGDFMAVENVVHFYYDNMSISGLSVSQGPNSGKLQITIFGNSFPSRSTLLEFTSDSALKISFSGGKLASGKEAIVQGFSKCETPAGFVPCPANMTSIVFLSSTEVAITVPRLQLDGNTAQDKVNILLSLNGLDFTVPSLQTEFQAFNLPTILGWSPLYGLFEQELTITIMGINFTDLGASVCRFPTIHCYDDNGLLLDPCIVPALYVSSSEMQCTMPGIRRIGFDGDVTVSSVRMEFSPFATDYLRENYKDIFDSLFIKSEQDFVFHLPFDTATLSLRASPVNIAGTKHKLTLDTTKQMVRFYPGGPLQCLPMEKIFRERSLRLALRNVGSATLNTFTPVNITTVQDIVGGCAELGGFCRSDSCSPSPDNRNPSCCSGANMDSLTCCPLSSSNISLKCFVPNIIPIDPIIAVGSLTEICTSVIIWSPPVIFLCKSGFKDGEPCDGDSGKCPGGVCVQTPILADLRISTNKGLQFASPVNSQVIFYSPSSVQSVFPPLVMKDCGSTDCWLDPNSNAGARDAGQTICGQVSLCERREQVVVAVHCPMDLAQMCSTCRVISKQEARVAFGTASCRFTSRLDRSAQVVVLGKYSFDLDYPSVTCTAPVFTNPTPVDIEVALDGATFVSAQGGGTGGTILFIGRPSVSSVLPTNSVFDTQTSFTVRGDQFCNETAGSSCGVNSSSSFCIFDFKSVAPTSDQWAVQRMYTPALVQNPNQLVCNAPVFTPDTVPARPRAQVGFMPNLRFTAGNIPVNIVDKFVSSAYVIFHSRPVMVQIMPSTGPSALQTVISIQATGIFSSFPGCLVVSNTGAITQTDLNLGNDPNTSCSMAVMPDPLLFCEFGSIMVRAKVALNIRSSTPSNQVSTISCNSPNGSSFSQIPFDVRVGLNGFKSEFSSPTTFLYVDVNVWDLFPKFGVDVNADFVNIVGTNFKNVTQLTCFFSPVVGNILAGKLISRTLERKAVFLSSNSVKCTLPNANEFPLMCSCKCQGTACSNEVYSTNLVAYSKSGVPTYSQKSVTSSVCACCKDPAQSNTSCTIGVSVGSNIQNMGDTSHPVFFQYDITAPVV